MTNDEAIAFFIHLYVGAILFCFLLPLTHLVYILFWDGCLRSRHHSKLESYRKQHPELVRFQNPLLGVHPQTNSLVTGFDGYDEL